jgi:hypothetical protein
MLFRTGSGGMKVTVDITFGRDRDQQVIRLDLDSHDAYACLSPTARHNGNLLRLAVQRFRCAGAPISDVAR